MLRIDECHIELDYARKAAPEMLFGAIVERKLRVKKSEIDENIDCTYLEEDLATYCKRYNARVIRQKKEFIRTVNGEEYAMYDVYEFVGHGNSERCVCTAYAIPVLQ